MIGDRFLENLKGREPDFLEPDKKHKGYICPACGNGGGETGDGLRRIPDNPNLWKCFKGGCGKAFDVISLWALHNGLDPAKDFSAAVEGLASYYGLTIEYSDGDTAMTNANVDELLVAAAKKKAKQASAVDSSTPPLSANTAPNSGVGSAACATSGASITESAAKAANTVPVVLSENAVNAAQLAPPEKPIALRVIPENIPDELKAIPQWVLWRYKLKRNTKGYKWTKPPMQANGGYADSTNPDTWTDYETALAAYQRGGFDGIGFVHTPESGFIGVDIDHCVEGGNPASNERGKIAAQIINDLASYTEISPSGGGVRIWVKAALSDSAKADSIGLEVYNGRTQGNKKGGRYLTITGHRVTACADIAANQEGAEQILKYAQTARDAAATAANKTAQLTIAPDATAGAVIAAPIVETAAPSANTLPAAQLHLDGAQIDSLLARPADLIKYAQTQLTDPRALAYLEKRGLTLETAQRFGFGFIDNWRASAQAKYTPRLIIPSENNAYMARLIISGAGKAEKLKGPNTGVYLFNAAALVDCDGKNIFVTEGEIDAATIEQAGGRAVALGTAHATINLTTALDAIAPARPRAIILALDNDESGQDAARKLRAELSAKGFDVYDSDALNFDGKDANAAYLRSPEKFATYVKEGMNKDPKEDYKGRFVSAHIDLLRKAIKDNESGAFIKSGFAPLDKILGGGLRSGLYVLGAISSLGKTSFALQLADQLAARGQDVIFFSLEMAETELMAKSVSRYTAIETARNGFNLPDGSSGAVTTNKVLDGAAQKFYSAERRALIDRAIKKYADECGPHLIIYQGNGDIDVNYIRERVAEHQRFTGNAPVVFVDYLQILASVDPKMSDKQNADHNTHMLKVIARQGGFPLIAISSFNRESYYAPVNLSAFKESGGIEYSADVLIGMQYQGTEERAVDKDSEKKIRKLIKDTRADGAEGKVIGVQICVLKNRNGICGTMNIDFVPRYNWFNGDNESCKIDGEQVLGAWADENKESENLEGRAGSLAATSDTIANLSTPLTPPAEISNANNDAAAALANATEKVTDLVADLSAVMGNLIHGAAGESESTAPAVVDKGDPDDDPVLSVAAWEKHFGRKLG